MALLVYDKLPYETFTLLLLFHFSSSELRMSVRHCIYIKLRVWLLTTSIVDSVLEKFIVV